MTYGWPSSPTKAETKTRILNQDGTVQSNVYSIGKYQVTVPGEELPITYMCERWKSGDPRQTLPNMEITDGEIRIPISDLVEETLTRLQPADLARELWVNDEVRSEFMNCLVTRWSESGITDADRRTFLDGVKEAVHSKAIDDLAKTMHSIEYAVRNRAYFSQEMSRINDYLRDKDVRDRDGNLVQMKDVGGTEYEIGKGHWNESRDYWREEIAKRFPGEPT